MAVRCEYTVKSGEVDSRFRHQSSEPGNEIQWVDTADGSDPEASITYLCPDCGAPMIIIETFERGQLPRAPPERIGAS